MEKGKKETGAAEAAQYQVPASLNDVARFAKTELDVYATGPGHIVPGMVSVACWDDAGCWWIHSRDVVDGASQALGRMPRYVAAFIHEPAMGGWAIAVLGVRPGEPDIHLKRHEGNLHVEWSKDGEPLRVLSEMFARYFRRSFDRIHGVN